MQSGSLRELQATMNWLRTQPHAIKIVVAGNHNLFLDVNLPRRETGTSETPSSLGTSIGDEIDWRDII